MDGLKGHRSVGRMRASIDAPSRSKECPRVAMKELGAANLEVAAHERESQEGSRPPLGGHFPDG